MRLAMGFCLGVAIACAIMFAVVAVAQPTPRPSTCTTTVFAQTADTLWMQTRCVWSR